MPMPHAGESEKDFVTRCVPIVIAEGTARDGAQAAAICHSMYQNRNNTRLGAIEQVARVRGMKNGRT